MWTFGVIIGLLLALISGLAKGLSNRLIFHPETLPKYMNSRFWQFSRKKNRGDIESRNLFIIPTSGYSLLEAIHGLFLAAGSILLSISIFFAAETPSAFIREQTLLLVAIFAARCIGKFLTYRNGATIWEKYK